MAIPRRHVLRHALVPLLWLVLASACDITGGPEACPPRDDGNDDYFAAAEGVEWVFDAEAGHTGGPFNPRATRRVGVTTWVFEEDVCESGVRTFTVAESFAGVAEQRAYDGPWTVTDTVRSARTLVFVWSDGLNLGPYAYAPIPGAYPPEAPDTARTGQNRPGSVHDVWGQTLVRGRGLVALTHSVHEGLAAGGAYERLIRTR